MKGTWLSTWHRHWCSPWSLGSGTVRFLYCKVTPHPPPYTALSGRKVTTHRPHPRSGKLEGGVSTYIIWNFSAWETCLFPHDHWGLMDIDFKLLVMISYCFIYYMLILYQLWPLGTFFSRILYLWHTTSVYVYVCVLSTSLLSGAVRTYEFLFYISCPRPIISHLSRSIASLYWRKVLETKACLLTVGCFASRPSQLTEEMCAYIYI